MRRLFEGGAYSSKYGSLHISQVLFSSLVSLYTCCAGKIKGGFHSTKNSEISRPKSNETGEFPGEFPGKVFEILETRFWLTIFDGFLGLPKLFCAIPASSEKFFSSN